MGQYIYIKYTVYMLMTSGPLVTRFFSHYCTNSFFLKNAFVIVKLEMKNSLIICIFMIVLHHELFPFQSLTWLNSLQCYFTPDCSSATHPIKASIMSRLK